MVRVLALLFLTPYVKYRTVKTHGVHGVHAYFISVPKLHSAVMWDCVVLALLQNNIEEFAIFYHYYDSFVFLKSHSYKSIVLQLLVKQKHMKRLS